MAKTLSPKDLRRKWQINEEVALLDVREEGPYAVAHPFFALSVPVSEVETKLPHLVPRRSAAIVVYDNGEAYTERAANRILDLGYSDVSILAGGLAAYARIGEVFRDVNVPSKAFGELVEAICQTPSLPAKDVNTILKEDDVVVLDVRRFAEYNTMSIPRGRSCPGGELVYRFFEAVPSPDTTVIVHCAGRTRSIIGTQSLVNCGFPNKIVALRNGTIGWTLEGLTLESKKTERVPEPSRHASSKGRIFAEAWAQKVGVSVISPDKLRDFITEATSRTLYLLDVRDPSEYAISHPTGFLNAPGGQLIQATDEWIGVRGARLVLYDTDGVRAQMTATWLFQMGWEVYVLQEPPRTLLGTFTQRKSQHSIAIDPKGMSVYDLHQLLDTTVVDLARSPVYRRGHIPGAWFASGPELARDLTLLGGTGPIVLTSTDGRLAAENVEYARTITGRDVKYLFGGTEAWEAAGNAVETEPRWLSEPIDVYKRPYEGLDVPKQNMQDYIDWEHQLVAQLANDGISGFKVIR
ncbi:hypothetical protein G7046_g1865 [Stylonectria norvegica]|nr:hypothetical protein G7046_g1865 [Stylonectria norvegica]